MFAYGRDDRAAPEFAALTRLAVREAETVPLHLAAPDPDPAPPPDPRSLAIACLDDMKALDVVGIDLVGRTSIADAMIIASGTSARHVGAVAERLISELKDAGCRGVRVEGFPACDWVLIDAGDLIVHVFRPEVRSFYNLEKMWGADRPVERDAV